MIRVGIDDHAAIATREGDHLLHAESMATQRPDFANSLSAIAVRVTHGAGVYLGCGREGLR